MVVLYKTVLIDPEGREGWYYGIHQTQLSDRQSPMWDKDHPDGYIGSGGLFQSKDSGFIRTLKPGWRHVSTEVLEELTGYDLGRERELIKESWELYGVHPQVRAWGAAHNIKLPYKDGIVLNCQATSAENLWPTDGSVSPCNTEEALKKKSDSLRNRYETDPSYRTKISDGLRRAFVNDSTISQRCIETKRMKYGGEIPGWSSAVEAARSKESRAKAVATRYAKTPKWSCMVAGVNHTGTLRKVAAEIGALSAYSFYRKYVSKNESSFVYKGFTFKLISND